MASIARLVFGNVPKIAQAAAPRAEQRALFSAFPSCPVPSDSKTTLFGRVSANFGFAELLWKNTVTNFNLDKHPETSEPLKKEELDAGLKLIQQRGPTPQIRLPKGENLQEHQQWAQELLKTLFEKKKPVANYHFSTGDIKTKRPSSDTMRYFRGNDVEGLKRLAEDLEQGKQFDGTVCLGNLNLGNPDIRDALANVMTQPGIRYQNLDQTGVPAGLKDSDFQSSSDLGGLLS